MLTRMLLLVVLMLLPAMLAGTLLEVPGAGCAAHHCCTLRHCQAHDHEGHAATTSCNEQHHHHHCHVRMQLMREVEPRLQRQAPPVFAAEDVPVMMFRAGPYAEQVVRVMLMGSSPSDYRGYLPPRRC